MTDFLQTIELEYGCVRGQASLLSPSDWQLAAEWEAQGVPLRLAVRTMREISNQKTNRINSLQYFDQAIQEKFNTWQAANVGKANNNQTNPHDQNNTMQSIKPMIISNLFDKFKLKPLTLFRF